MILNTGDIAIILIGILVIFLQRQLDKIFLELQELKLKVKT